MTKLYTFRATGDHPPGKPFVKGRGLLQFSTSPDFYNAKEALHIHRELGVGSPGCSRKWVMEVVDE